MIKKLAKSFVFAIVFIIVVYALLLLIGTYPLQVASLCLFGCIWWAAYSFLDWCGED